MMGLAKFSDSSLTAIFVESIGLRSRQSVAPRLLGACVPAGGVVGIVQLLSDRSRLERRLGLDHNCQFIRGIFPQACFHGSRLSSVVYSSPVQCERSDLDSAAAAEVSADVVEDLVAVDVAVVVWDWYGLRVVVEFSRHER